MKTKAVLFALPLVVFGLYLLFGIPAYLHRAPEWYFELPSVLPPTLWAPASRVLGIVLLAVATFVLIAAFARKSGKTAARSTELVVLIQHENQELLEDLAWLLEGETESLAEIYGLVELSFLRGDYPFCLVWLKQHADKEAIVVVSPRAFANRFARERLMTAGAKQVYGFQGKTHADLMERVRECIHHYRTGYF